MAIDITSYLDSLVPPRPAELQRMEAHAKETRFPIIGPAAGQFCYLMARAVRATSVFEMGSGFGYSTAWWAQAVRDNGGGVVHHVVWDEELSDRASKHLHTLGLDQYVKYHVGEAVAALRGQHDQFDIIFNDIDKGGYPASIPVIRDKLKTGGVLIVDNALWHNRIFDAADESAQTVGVREATRLLTQDPGWTTSLVPIRDGMLIAYKV